VSSFREEDKMKEVIAVALSLVASPVLAGSGQMVKMVGAGDPDAPYCVWFKTSNGSNGMDPLRYGYSMRDVAYHPNLININNALNSLSTPRFVVGTPPRGVGQFFFPDDCPAAEGYTYVHDIKRP
jgi:hypothetical protein